MKLSPLAALSLTAALIAAVATFFLLTLHLLIWAAFIEWASYFHSGANAQAALRSSAALVCGVVLASLAAMVLVSRTVPLDGTLATAIVAGISAFLICLHLRCRSSVSSPPYSVASRRCSLISASHPGLSRLAR